MINKKLRKRISLDTFVATIGQFWLVTGRLRESGIGLARDRIRIPMLHFFWILFLLQATPGGAVEFDRAILHIAGVPYNFEIAKTTSQRQQGLMWRTKLGSREGMLFVYPRVGAHRIWMKNTLIPLSVVWLDKDGIVIAVKLLLPCEPDSCPSFGVSEPTKYIIELNSEASGIMPGDSISEVKRFD
jgi:uncharacterized membrane protein (UPF0127 family)